MVLQNGTVYPGNYARAAAYYLATCAPKPVQENRQAAYQLVTGLYQLVYDDPAVLGWKAMPDTYFQPWEQQKGREKDIKSIRDPIAKVEALVQEVFALSEAGEKLGENALLLPEGYPALKRPTQRALTALGCVLEPGQRTTVRLPFAAVTGLKELCAVSRAHCIPITDGPQEPKAHLLFSRCVFQPEENWTARAFDGLLNAGGELVRLCQALEQRGYARTDCRDGKKVSLDYSKQTGKKPEPLKTAWAERTHLGIEVSYEELRLEPGFLWLRMPTYKTVLANLDKLPPDTAAFLAAWTKTCNGCRYCVQTDKTHTRPLAAILVDGKPKCPLYPGFTMNWRGLTPELPGQLLAALDALEQLPELA